tara:strand:+ start:49 stop:630 length:582 start_codon:yes stop_codon:yes gene_type:complete
MPIALNGSGTISGISVGGLPDGIVDTDMLAAGAVTAAKRGAGAILQVVSATKTDTFSTSSTSLVQITGLSVNITPTSTSSKILVSFSIDGSNTSNGAASAIAAVFKDGSNYLGSNVGNRPRGWQLANYGDKNTGENISFQFLDSPSTTSQITYDLRIKAQASTATVNMSGSDNDVSDYGYRSASSITAMEVAA